MKKREPAILTDARKYNRLCGELQAMRDKGEAPRGAVCPEKIDLERLFELDVDAGIWNDVGLFDEDEGDVLRWLADIKVHRGFLRC